MVFVSTDGSAALAWQVELLRHSHARAGHTAALVVRDDVEPEIGAAYPPSNRPWALHRWARGADISDATVMILDPDMVFVEAVRMDVRRGTVMADAAGPPLEAAGIRALTAHQATGRWLQPWIPPIVVHGSDLPPLAERWLAWTRTLHADQASREALDWLVELWAFVLAARDMGLRVEQRQLAALPPNPHPAGLPLIHYGWAAPCFDKRRYRPWEPLPRCPHPAHRVMGQLIAEHRENASARPGGRADAANVPR